MDKPILHQATDLHRGLLAWNWAEPMSALSSAAIGGGLTQPDWLLNIGVPPDFAQTDLHAYVEGVVAEAEFNGDGIALLTAVDVRSGRNATCEGVSAHATVGASKATWAADSSGGYTPWAPGTINIVVHVPVCLSPGAQVNAVMTATEAKTQALHERGVPGTGTASDAVVIVWPTPEGKPTPFAGPRSEWGSRIARAVHAAVSSGIPS